MEGSWFLQAPSPRPSSRLSRAERLTPPFGLLAAGEREQLASDIEDAFPLSQLQRGMLFHGTYEASSTAYQDLFTFQLRTLLPPERLRTALEGVVARHPMLRVSFELTGFSEPLQRVHRTVTFEWGTTDLSALSEQAQQEVLAEHGQRERLRPFDWRVPPLFRVHVFRRAADRLQLVLCLHHAIADGWSVARMLSELYRAALNPTQASSAETDSAAPAELSAAARTGAMRELVALERAALTSEPTRHFWKERLQGHELVRLPRLAPVQAEKTARSHGLRLSPEWTKRLLGLAERLGVPLKTVLLTAHVRVMALLAGGEQVVTGLVSNGRPELPGVEQAVGLFLNTLPLALRLPEVSWAGLIRRMAREEAALLPHRWMPLHELQRLQGGQPLFETTFNYVHFHVFGELPSDGGIEVLETGGVEETNFALATTFSRSPQDGCLNAAFASDTGVLSPAQLEAIAGYYERTLAAMLTSPEQAWQQVSLLDATEYHQLLHDWNRTTCVFPQTSPVHVRVLEQARRTPTALAVSSPGGVLTYEALVRQARQLACGLRARGVGPDVIVGICMERTTQLVVSLLGVLLAGGAYAPLDPDLPDERLLYLANVSGARCVLAEGASYERLRLRGLPVVSPELLKASEAAEPPQWTFHPEQLAYVLYTSGSTGEPRGVAIPHRALSNHMDWMQQTYPLDAQDRVLQKTSIGFDASVWEFWAPLLEGATLVLAPAGAQQDPALLLKTLVEEHITILQGVPTLLQLLALEPGLERCRTLRRIFSGGEALRLELVQALQQALPATPVINLYGPTEVTIDSVVQTIEPPRLGPGGSAQDQGEKASPESVTGSVPIGLPISNLQAYVLDRTLSPVPLGVVGELYLGGVGLARGYQHRPALTAAAFIPDPFAVTPGGRLYRTGDLARRRADGTLEYLGRADDQLKLAGRRIEPGEIVAVLERHPAVRQAHVGTQARPEGGLVLVAWLVAEETPDLRATLRQHLREQLPAYMVPQGLCFLERMPVGPGGKLARRALPEVLLGAFTSTSAGPAPQTPQEQVLAECFARALGRAQVGLDDNFFDLGGDSIVSLQLVAECRRRGWKLTPRQIFEQQTITRLAPLLERLGSSDEADVSGLPLPLTPAQQAFLALNAPTPQHWNQSVLVTVPAHFEERLFREVLAWTFQRHEALRLCFRRRGEGFEPHIQPPPVDVPFIRLDWSVMAHGQLATALEARGSQEQAGLDLEHGPLFKAVWFDLGRVRPGRLLLVAHHLVVDGVSWRILLADMAEAYRQVQAGTPLETRLPETTFSQWARRLKGLAEGPEQASWATWYTDARWQAVRPLPVDRAGGTPLEAETQTLFSRLDEPQTRALLQAPRVYRAGAEVLLLTALARTLQAWVGQGPVRIEVEGHGRELPEQDVELVPGLLGILLTGAAYVPLDLSFPRERLAMMLEDGAVSTVLTQHSLRHLLLEQLPLTPNGKLDRRALPEPNLKALSSAQALPPRTALEEVLASIWAELLKLERVGIQQHFLELGGHSLLVMQAAERIRRVFGIELPLGEFFQVPTVETLAQHLLKKEQAPGRLEKVATALIRLRQMSPEEREQLRRRKEGSGPRQGGGNP